ncbi:YIP1 family protein [Dictyobacter aurantiacus]|uniref:Yip1 domain-containing protein n=1 Tax=Dictyobacter aurantiacus TaxID=1936993 RepID=A0A401Z837_9CHLR|nr:YIP1 family protein [Dictyobacter aurantiacus]GCE02995.1 hypothetical protein KDAU_03240 [Dictyobacter aurantiacus]
MSYNPDQGSYPGAFPPGSGYEPYGPGDVTETPSQPLPLREAVCQLPIQYFRVLTRPNASTFMREKGKAAWNIIWAQVLMLTVISAIFTILRIIILPPTRVIPIRNGSVLNSMLMALQAINSLGPAFEVIVYVIWAVVAFFLSTSINYLIARIFGGRGTFKQYSYSSLLISTPRRVADGLIGLIPIASINALFIMGTFVYQVILQIYMTMAVHRLRGGRATMAVLLLPIIIVILACIAAFLIVAMLLASLHK